MPPPRAAAQAPLSAVTPVYVVLPCRFDMPNGTDLEGPLCRSLGGLAVRNYAKPESQRARARTAPLCMSFYPVVSTCPSMGSCEGFCAQARQRRILRRTGPQGDERGYGHERANGETVACAMRHRAGRTAARGVSNGARRPGPTRGRRGAPRLRG